MDSRTRRRWTALAALGALAGCAFYHNSQKELLRRQTGPMFFSDLGPDQIDVSSYPPEQRRNYAVYARVCSRCHSLARSINCPVASRGFWEMYVQAMRRRSAYAPVPEISPEEVDAIVDFLDYDAVNRKIARRAEFDASTAELKRRFSTEPSRLSP